MLAVGDLVRRGVENGHHHVTKEHFASLPGWGAALMGVTFVVFMLLVAGVEYTFSRLIPTLMMVESPEAVLFEPLSSEDPDAPRKDQKVDPELLLVQQKPITSSFRSTIRHLRSRAGRFSRFCGYWFYILYTFSIQTLASAISVFSFIPNCVAPVIAGVVLSQLQMLWTHVVISEPTQQRWLKRADFSMASWKVLALPTAVLAVAEQLTLLLPAYLAMAYGLNPAMSPEDFAKYSNAEMQIMVLKGLSVGALAIAVSVLAVIPANVALTRVQASLLSDSEETIVPFDRSFGGKVVPRILGGSGAVGTIDAWKTFDWNSRIRLVKAYFKASVMQFAISLLMVSVLFCELVAITGGDIQKVVPDQGTTNEVRILPINI